MKALVTGGTGFVGGAVVRELLRLGHEVKVLARATSKTEPLERLGVSIVCGDILDGASITRALAGCDTLFHAAAIYEFWVQDHEQLMKTEVDGSRNAMEAALAAGVERVVYTSSSVVVGQAKGELGAENTVHRGYFLSVPAQPEMETERFPLVSIPPFGRGFSRHGGLSIRCGIGESAKAGFRAPLHRLDESTRLSLGMVASPRSLLPFHLAEPL